MFIVVIHKFIMICLVDMSLIMKFRDSSLRPINTVLAWVRCIAMDSLDRFGSGMCRGGVGEAAKDHVMLSLSIFVVASEFLVVGLEDTTLSFLAYGVNDVPLGRFMRILRMDMHGPMFVLCTHFGFVEGYVVLYASIYRLKR